jgi:hypothetical protein
MGSTSAAMAKRKMSVRVLISYLPARGLDRIGDAVSTLGSRPGPVVRGPGSWRVTLAAGTRQLLRLRQLSMHGGDHRVAEKYLRSPTAGIVALDGRRHGAVGRAQES